MPSSTSPSAADRRRPRAALALAAWAACAILATAAAAQPAETVVRFTPGTSSATLNGQLKGPTNDARDYVVRAESRQVLGVKLTTLSPETWFAVLHPYGDRIYTNEGDQRTEWSGQVIDGGDYRVRVYLGREAAQQAKGATFTLNVTLEAPR